MYNRLVLFLPHPQTVSVVCAICTPGRCCLCYMHNQLLLFLPHPKSFSAVCAICTIGYCCLRHTNDRLVRLVANPRGIALIGQRSRCHWPRQSEAHCITHRTYCLCFLTVHTATLFQTWTVTPKNGARIFSELWCVSSKQ
jgi:hypothetical protein